MPTSTPFTTWMRDVADGEGDVGEAADGLHEALSFFGVGRVPFMVVWGTLFIFTGFAGIFFNRVAFVRLAGGYPGWLFALTAPFSLIVGLAATRIAARLAGKLVDTGGRGSSRKHELVGAHRRGGQRRASTSASARSG